MNSKHTPSSFLAKISIFFLFSSLLVSVADAKAQKFRGYIVSIEPQAKTMVIQHKKHGEMSLKWNEETKVRRGSLEDLVPGKGVRNIMNDPDDGFIKTIRIDPEQDKPVSEE